MKKIVAFMHVSLDGFVAGPNGEMDWINVDDELFDYAGKMIDRADVALYGRVTYEMMEGYWPTAADQPNASKHDIEHSAWYKKVDKVVLSTTMKSNLKVKVVKDNLAEEISKIKNQGGKDIVIFGSPRTTHALMQNNLVDEFWLFINPILIGKGMPMFSEISERRKLKLLETKIFSSGVLGLHYQNAN
jgi:dihydrofolate reductase